LDGPPGLFTWLKPGVNDNTLRLPSIGPSQQPSYILSRPAEHGPIAPLHNWALHQIRMFDHQLDYLGVTKLAFCQT
jgi:hypothetical protein